MPYLLEFLDAYDFANDSKDEVTNNAKSLISASVLGLIFEKINGYKDGSFYTPSFITMYMARETITKAVIDKFNTAYSWQCKNLVDLHNSIKDIPQANALINSITICDPAVGSGHFLVSALNEILYIKSEIGVLIYAETGKKITDYSFSIESDELIIKDDAGEIFEYKKGSDTKTRLQKTLFKEKQTIIENCLFGVDINPNSVNICRLRLWVELLKNAYYKPVKDYKEAELDTLPNIDINIKCGNSLINRFDLKDDLNSKTIKAEIKDYKTKIADYKQTIGTKQQVLQAIDNIKIKFKTDLKASHASTKKLNDALNQYVGKYSLDNLTSAQKLKAIDELKLIGKQSSFIDDAEDLADKAKLKKALDNAWLAVEEIESGKIYQNAFEWRFEFPEVMNDDGDFVGFDVVLGNPPYIFTREMISYEDKNYFNENYKQIQFKINLYLLFVEKSWHILNKRGSLSYIIPNNWLSLETASNFRHFVLTQAKNISIVNCKDNIFDNASVDTSILNFDNYGKGITTVYELEDSNFNFIQTVNSEVFVNNKNHLISFGKNVTDEYSIILKKIALNSTELEKIAEVRNGIQAYTVGEGKPQLTESMKKERVYHSKTKIDAGWLKYVDGMDVCRYQLGWSGQYVKYGNNLSRPRKKEYFVNDRLLVRQIPSKPPYSIFSCFVNELVVNDNNSMIIVNSINNYCLKYILAILNSRLISFWFLHTYGKFQRKVFPQFKINELREFPIKEASSEKQQLYIIKVNDIMEAKQNNQDTSQLEAEIDAMVYQLYQLTPDEISVIEAII